MTRSHPTRDGTSLTETEAAARIHGICFKTGPPRRLGVELEWLVHPVETSPHPYGTHHPYGPTPLDPMRLDTALRALRATPLHSALTVEPGGQLELSSAPADSLAHCLRFLHEDLHTVRTLLREHGFTLVGEGLDPYRPARRLLDLPRYRAMEAYFDRSGPDGRAMMCSSASVQVCVDAGTEEPGPDGHARRWLVAHLLGAVLLAAFANSPLYRGAPTGWRSTRQAIWASLDGTRTLSPSLRCEPRTAWARYALDARVLCVRGATDEPWVVPTGRGFTFRQWLRGAGPRRPDPDDLDYHLTTLFPPVRPRGHLELRMIDAQPGDDGWVVPTAVTAALFDDPEAAERAYRAVKPLADIAGPRPAPRNPLWRRAARYGLADPDLHAAARTCFTAAREALPRLGAGAEVLAEVDRFTARYVDRGRCPADDVLVTYARRSLGGPDGTLRGGTPESPGRPHAPRAGRAEGTDRASAAARAAHTDPTAVPRGGP